MTKRDMVVSVLQSLGLKPQIDNDGDVCVCYQMKTFYVMETQSDEEDYLLVIFPRVYDLDEGEEAKVLAVCNKITREIKRVKMYVNETFESVLASCDFYYTDEESLKLSLAKSIEVLGTIRITLHQTMRSLE